MTYKINEYFQTMQGEGFFTGTPAFFIRMQGCNVGCNFCDTKYTWSQKTNIVDYKNLKSETPQYSLMSDSMILNESGSTRHIVITGGEPCLYDLTSLTALLIDNGKIVQIETSATETIEVHNDVWVTLSPKFNNPTKKTILEQAIKRANEFKFPIAKLSDLDFLDEFFHNNAQNDRLVWLQPISQGEESTKVCLEEARKRGWRISIQTHKYLGLR